MAKLEPKFFAEEDKPDFRDPELYTEMIAEFKRTPQARRPYVLLGGLTRDLSDLSAPRWRPMCHALYACSPGGLASDLRRYLKRMIILDYYFPSEDRVPMGVNTEGLLTRSGWAVDYKSDEGRAKRQDLMAVIREAKGESGAIFSLNKEKAALEQRVKDLEAKAAAVEKPRSGK